MQPTEFSTGVPAFNSTENALIFTIYDFISRLWSTRCDIWRNLSLWMQSLFIQWHLPNALGRLIGLLQSKGYAMAKFNIKQERAAYVHADKQQNVTRSSFHAIQSRNMHDLDIYNGPRSNIAMPIIDNLHWTTCLMRIVMFAPSVPFRGYSQSNKMCMTLNLTFRMQTDWKISKEKDCWTMH